MRISQSGTVSMLNVSAPHVAESGGYANRLPAANTGRRNAFARVHGGDEP